MLRNYDGYGAKDVPERFQWTFPVLLSPHDPSTLYVTSQHVWRSRDEGASWERISGDLTVHDSSTLQRTGGPIHGEMTGAEWYATIYAFAESPRLKGVLWAGSDDGLVHVSRDGGATWQNVTPPGYGKFTRTAHIDPSPHDPATVYVAANRYQQDDFKPYLWKSTDYGRTWTAIVNGIPANAYTRVVREDVVRRGLLYAGTELGVFVSFDDGARWEPLQLNLPRVSVRDLKVHGNDLVAATHGRSFWVVDDLSPLRQLHDSVTRKAAHLFQPAPAIRWEGSGSRSLLAGENPRGGVYVDYYFRERPTDRVTLEFLDTAGKVLRSYNSEREATDSAAARGGPARPPDSLSRTRRDTLPPLTAARLADSLAKAMREASRDSIAYEYADSIVSARKGTNRFVWGLRVTGAKKMKNTVIDLGPLDGPLVPPGNYVVRLIVGKDTLARSWTLVTDPRVKTTVAELTQQYELALRIRDKVDETADNSLRAEDLQSQVDARVSQTKDQSYAKRVADAGKALRDKLEGVRAELYEVFCHVDQCTLDQHVKLYNWFISLAGQVQQGQYPPTRVHNEVMTDLSRKLDVQLGRLRAIEENDVKAFNALLQELGVPGIFVVPRKAGVAM